MWNVVLRLGWQILIGPADHPASYIPHRTADISHWPTESSAYHGASGRENRYFAFKLRPRYHTSSAWSKAMSSN